MTSLEARQKILNMTEQERESYNLQICPRCSGTGKYSFCTMYGNVCFKCNGVGFIKKSKTRKNKEN